MVDRISREQRSKIMSAIHSENTKPERNLRKALYANGLRFRIHYCSEKIDIAFPTKKVAIFVDGCFWHGCPIHSHIPKSNEKYWLPKLRKNIQRDQEKNNKLRADGWAVLRFWEHELDEMQSVVYKVKATLLEKTD